MSAPVNSRPASVPTTGVPGSAPAAINLARFCSSRLPGAASSLATPMAGGHYFVDVFAGVAVAVLAIAAAKRLGAWLTQGVRAPVAAMSMPEAAVPAE